ncbi:MAG: sugar phosphate isomerase/epimerase family protein [Lachnospiraceae bacterium]
MIQIGIRAHDMEKAPIDKLVENINKKGFSCTQLALSKAITSFNTDIEAMTPGFALYLKKIFEKNNVDIAVLGCYQELGCKEDSEFKNIRKLYEAHIRFAALLGCGMVGTETWTKDMNAESDEALERLTENMRQIVSYAEKMGVIIGMEPVASHIVYDFKRARRVLDNIDSPNLQIIFDPVNVITKDNYENQEYIIREAFELCKDEIACIHAKDFILDKEGNIKPVIAGDGMLDYKLLFQILRRKKPFIHVLLEETTPDNVFNAKEYLENMYEKA